MNAGALLAFVRFHAWANDRIPSAAAGLSEDQRLRSYVNSLDDTALSEPLAIGPNFTVPRWLILSHVVNHGTQHRSEVGRYLTECDHSPGDLDLLDALVLRWPGEPDVVLTEG